MPSSTALRFLAAVAVLSLAVPLTARSQSASDDVWQMSIRGDTYAAGGVVDITQRTDGDLIVAGGNVSVEGGTAGDLLAVGGQVDISGAVKDDLRVAGGRVQVRGNIGGDLVIVGGEVMVDAVATIAGDLMIFGGTVRMGGVVSGDARVEADDVTVAGDVKGNLTVRGGQVQLRSRVLGNATLVVEQFQASPQAKVEGKIEYWMATGPQNFGSLAGGGAVYRPDLKPVLPDVGRDATVGIGLGLIGLSAYGLLTTALFVVLVLLMTKTMFVQAGKVLRKKPLRSLWHGFLWLAVMPLIGIVLCITIIGLPLGLFILVLYAFTLVFLKAIVSLVIARALQDHWGQTWSFWLAFLWTMLVYVVLKILEVIPLVGWLAVILLCLAGFGAYAQVKWERSKKIR